ncbi:MAG: insulinase family protein, partial [Flavobacterium sp.]
GMNAIVFQELREKRGLAYSAWARYAAPSTPNEPFRNLSFIQTQNDKVIEALNAFNELFNDMPQSENSFTLSKESMMNGMEAERINNMDIIWSFIANRRMGRDYDLRKKIYEALPKMTMVDVKAFNEKNIKEQPKTYVILGNEKLLNFDEISKQFGPVERVSAEDYFGY